MGEIIETVETGQLLAAVTVFLFLYFVFYERENFLSQFGSAEERLKNAAKICWFAAFLILITPTILFVVAYIASYPSNPLAKPENYLEPIGWFALVVFLFVTGIGLSRRKKWGLILIKLFFTLGVCLFVVIDQPITFDSLLLLLFVFKFGQIVFKDAKEVSSKW
jgi:hypothetical protein